MMQHGHCTKSHNILTRIHVYKRLLALNAYATHIAQFLTLILLFYKP